MARGEPGLPASFTWRGRVYVVGKLLAKRKKTGSDRGDVYVRRHLFEIETTTGERMTIYCDRQTPRRGSRWWIYTVEQARPPQ